jgi:hypothetical protein
MDTTDADEDMDPRARNGIATRFKPGQSGNPAGPKPGYKQPSQIQYYALAKCREAIDVVARVMREPKDGDNVRLRACEMILDRGLGKPNQAVALDVALKKPLENMSLEELTQFRERYAALVTASPKLIEHVIEAEQATLDPDHDDTEQVEAGSTLTNEAADDGEVA